MHSLKRIRVPPSSVPPGLGTVPVPVSQSNLLPPVAYTVKISAVFFLTYGTVSYTHLDVYKRQDRDCN